MKLSTHIFGLLVVFAAFSLIGCSKDDNQSPQQTAAKCLGTPGCTQAVVAAYMTAPPGTQAAMIQTANGVMAQLPPGATVNGTAPAQLPLAAASAQQVQQQARLVQQAMASASANPMSSYYVDPNAQDVPARSAMSEQLARMAVNNQNRQPTAAPQPVAPVSQDSSSIQ